MEYVEWAGKAKLLEGLKAELKEVEHAHYRLSEQARSGGL